MKHKEVKLLNTPSYVKQFLELEKLFRKQIKDGIFTIENNKKSAPFPRNHII